jgi:hypothetical protein
MARRAGDGTETSSIVGYEARSGRWLMRALAHLNPNEGGR